MHKDNTNNLSNKLNQEIEALVLEKKKYFA